LPAFVGAESSQPDEIQNGLKSSRFEIQNSLAMLEVARDRHVIVHNTNASILAGLLGSLSATWRSYGYHP
jgi:hypothetical protein